MTARAFTVLVAMTGSVSRILGRVLEVVARVLEEVARVLVLVHPLAGQAAPVNIGSNNFGGDQERKTAVIEGRRWKMEENDEL